MSMRIIFLGTSASVPTIRRSLPAVAVKREGELLLFDCGEGTQRQMIKVRVGLNKETKIFITHMHGDHVLGLPGVLQTMSMFGRTKSLYVFGPEGILDFIEAILRTVHFSLRFKIFVEEVEEGIICEEKEYVIKAVWAEHTVPTLAYALIEKPRPGRFNTEKAISLGVPKGPLWSKLQRGQSIVLDDGRIVMPKDVLGPPRPGRKVVYISDSRPCEKLVKLAENADILIHEATFSDELRSRAVEDMHSTASEAAMLASQAKVKRLILTHISARYNDPTVLLEEAKKIFPEVEVAEDLMIINVPYRQE